MVIGVVGLLLILNSTRNPQVRHYSNELPGGIVLIIVAVLIWVFVVPADKPATSMPATSSGQVIQQ